MSDPPPLPSSPLYDKLKQSDTSAPVSVCPPTPHKTNHASSPDNVTVVNTPEPAGTDAPVNEKPKTVEPPVETVNKAASAAPPSAPISSAPSTLN